MAYNISDEDLAKESINNTDWVLFYHRGHLKKLLPAMAQAYLLVGGVQKELVASQERHSKIEDNRKPECVANWPECENGTYHPKCCRFPKSCSCGF